MTLDSFIRYGSLWTLITQSGICRQKLSPASECTDICRDCRPLSRFTSIVPGTTMGHTAQFKGRTADVDTRGDFGRPSLHGDCPFCIHSS